MRFLHGQVKARKGDIIQVQFSRPTRVLVMTKREFEKYKNNLTFSYVGGQQEEPPYEFTVPKDMVYVVVVEKGSYYKPVDITASVKVVPGVVPHPSEHKETASEEPRDVSGSSEVGEEEPEPVAEPDDTERED